MRRVAIALMMMCVFAGAAEAGRRGFGNAFLLDYPLARPTLGNPGINGSFGMYGAYGSYGGYGPGFYLPAPPSDPTRLQQVNDLIDDYRLEREVAQLRRKVDRLELELKNRRNE